jgi:hypothetical protein
VVSTVGLVVNQPQTTGRNDVERTYKPRQSKTTATIAAGPKIMTTTVSSVPTSVLFEDNLLSNDSGLDSSPNQYLEQPRIVHFSPPPLRTQPTISPQPLREPPATTNDQISLLKRLKLLHEN